MARRHHLEVVVLAVLFLLALPPAAWAAEGRDTSTEKEISKKDLPAAVLSAFQSGYPNARIKDISLETEDSTTYYEIESMDGKVKRDLLYSADGTIKEIEEVISRAELPDAVKQAIKKEYPKGKIKEAEKVTKDGAVSYDLVVKNGKDKYEVAVSADGMITKTEKKEAEEDDEE